MSSSNPNIIRSLPQAEKNDIIRSLPETEKNDIIRSLPEEDIDLGYNLMVKDKIYTYKDMIFQGHLPGHDPILLPYYDERVMVLQNVGMQGIRKINYEVLGIHDFKNNRWTWPWANYRFSKRAAAFAKALCEKHDYEILKTPSFYIHERQVMDLVYYAMSQTRYFGWYVMRLIEARDVLVYILFRAEDVHPPVAWW